MIESISFKGLSVIIKIYYNVGGLLENMKLKFIEFLCELFKDEVCELGKVMGIFVYLVGRYFFFGFGFVVCILGFVSCV